MVPDRLVVEFVQRLATKTKKGEHRTQTIRHYWAICDECGEGTWVLSRDIKRTKTDPVPGRRCRMTPRCSGKHRKVS